MIPLRITAANYGPFEEIDLSLPVGATALIGPNGAGKTFLISAIDRALFGSRAMGEWLTAGETEEMSLCLEFESGGQLYRARRTYSGRGRGKSALDFEFVNLRPGGRVGHWQPLTREDQKATQALIEQSLGFSRTTFRASAFLDQEGSGSFTNPALDARHRKEMLFDLLGLAVYDALLERARHRVTTIRDQTSRLAIQVEEAERELERKAETWATQERLVLRQRTESNDLYKAEATHREATEALAASRETAAKLSAAREVLRVRERELGELVTRRRHLEGEIEEADALPQARAEAQAKAEPIPFLEAELDSARAQGEGQRELARLEQEQGRLDAEAAKLHAQARALFDEAEALASQTADICDRCGQELKGEARRRARESYLAEARQAEEKGNEIARQAGALPLREARARAESLEGVRRGLEIEADLRVARAAQARLGEIEVRLERVASLKIDLTEIAERHPELESAKADAASEVSLLEADAPGEDLEAKVARAYGTLVEARNAHKQTEQQLAVVKAELERLGKIEARAKEKRTALATHQAELERLTLAEQAVGRDGIPALVLENVALPLMEAKANEALARLGGKTASARIELRTQRSKKSGAGEIETLDIVVLTGEGWERRYDLWSGGEKMRIEIALRLGLLALAGVEMGILILDEPGNLDEAGKSDLIELLNSVLALGVERVLLVSHEEGLRDAFDQTIEVVQVDETRSRIETGEREAVAA